MFKPKRTETPVQTIGFVGVKRVYSKDDVDAGNPLQYDIFPLGGALSSVG